MNKNLVKWSGGEKDIVFLRHLQSYSAKKYYGKAIKVAKISYLQANVDVVAKLKLLIRILFSFKQCSPLFWDKMKLQAKFSA